MRFIKHNSLTIVMLGLFVLFYIGQIVTGFYSYNEENQSHNKPTVTMNEYLSSGHLWEATSENWESEFLQMAAYVLFTSFLIQKGSPESRRTESDEKKEGLQAQKETGREAPWPVRQGGWIKEVYSYSLTLVLFCLFLISFYLHIIYGVQEFNEEQLEHGHNAITALQYVGTPRFWFESFQNWQSEFLSVGILIILSIFLRQKNSPESKPVAAPHLKTGQ